MPTPTLVPFIHTTQPKRPCQNLYNLSAPSDAHRVSTGCLDAIFTDVTHNIGYHLSMKLMPVLVTGVNRHVDFS